MLEGAAGIAVPTLISTLAICCVFVSVFFLQGAARYLFTPLAMAVVFAMLASYGISRTLTPIIIRLLLRSEHAERTAKPTAGAGSAASTTASTRGFDRFRDFYGWLLAGILRRRILTPVVALCRRRLVPAVLSACSSARDFFPHGRCGADPAACARAGPHPHRAHRADLRRGRGQLSAQQIPPKDLGLVLDNIGLPQRTYNLAFTDGTTIGVNDGDDPDRSSRRAMRRQRTTSRSCGRCCPCSSPSVQFYFQPADLVTQMLNFGVPSQIDVQVQGQDRAANIAIAGQLRQQLANIPGIVDAHLQQELDAPEMYYTIDRTRAQELGLTFKQVANDLNISLSSSEQVSPNFWTDPKNGIPYYMAVQTPEYRLSRQERSRQHPDRAASLSAPARAQIPELLGNVATGASRVRCSRSTTSPTSSRSTTCMPACRDRDLGSAAAEIQHVVARAFRASWGPATGSSSAARSPA